MYTIQITRHNPTCIILLIDQSRSMNDSFGGVNHSVRKSDFVADTVNRTLHDLVIRCTKTEEIRNYYHIACLGYSGRGVASAFTGALARRTLVPIAEVAEYPARIETRYKQINTSAGGIIEQPVRYPVWVDAVGDGGTPMCGAFAEAREILRGWINDHPRSFPPVVLHLTDGESSDGDPVAIGRDIMSLATEDGATLVFNCHVSSRQNYKIEYPTSEAELPDEFARTLFRVSSVLPEAFRDAAAQLGVVTGEAPHGFVFNADPSSVIQFYQIGTSLTGMTPHAWMDA